MPGSGSILRRRLRDVHVQVVRLGLVGRPPHLAQDRAVRQQLPLVVGEAARAGRTRAASAARARPRRVTACFSRSMCRSPTSIVGSPVGPRAAQRGAQAREQLVDAERLRHVVVGAGVERRHLLAPRRRRPRGSGSARSSSSRSSRQTSMPLRSGRTRSRMTASGGRTAACVSASSPVAAVSTS